MDTHVSNYWRIYQGVLILIILLFSVTSQAALIGRNLDGDAGTFEAFYDDVLDITWLADANLAKSMTFGVGGIDSLGRMHWDTALRWIDEMNKYNAGNGYLGINNWRLPYQDPSSSPGMNHPTYDAFSNTVYSELGYMFYDNFQANAVTDGFPFGLDSANSQKKLFTNLELLYWTGTENSGDTNLAWAFDFFLGDQNLANKINSSLRYHVWTVSDGDVATSSSVLVPLPAAIWLFTGGLLGLLGVARKQ